ncbi:DUF4123 domain-containing protein [Pseudomonas fluorescens]|uniref:DUF4123 domain-containing protein n=1 Tax=Pseudomonas fluorescens TaxID=294 RepID=A0A423L1R5_PSEFL|nr:DUF4123 domain-containing protein [Pseudomonas fluorescens]RON62229.1 hypothetical protein BK671_24445 [Pseudomonas fluorescens]
MSDLALEPIVQWLLLDSVDAPQALQTLRQGFATVRCYWLFDDTEFASVREQGPVLIELENCPALAALCHRDPQTWRGLMLESAAPADALLGHLRRMLTVSFGLSQRALLGFYNRQTASYFFDACDVRELSRWLGPIQQLRWFGGTWADRAIGCEGWQQLRNPRLAVQPLGVEETLGRRQRERLQTCLLEQHIWRWCQSMGVTYPLMWSHAQQGLALGFSDRTMLDSWLWLRLQHPHEVLLPLPAGLTQQEGIEYLRQRWQNDQP